MREAVVVSVARTPVAKFRGDFAEFCVPRLGSLALRAALSRAGIKPDQIDEVILGNLFASDWGDPARACVLEAGWPVSVPAVTVDRQCSSSLDATALAASMIRDGMADVVMTGGVESCSQQPFYLKRPGAAYPSRMEFADYKTSVLGAGGNISMLRTAERMAMKYGITREECDLFALSSHQKASEAWGKGWLGEQVVPVEVPQERGGPKVVEKDACLCPDISMESLGKLRPVLGPGRVVTEGNASPQNDGASAVLVMSAEKAGQLGLKPLAVVREYCAAGCEPAAMGIGPVYATRRLMERYGYQIDDFDLVELDEVFAAQALACIRELELRPERVNVEGGAIAVGHPDGASGGVLVGRMVCALRRRRLKRGLVTFCCGGGQGVSLVLENPEV